LTSKIINMAEKLKDAEDRLLESLFRMEPVPDAGFSNAVIRQIRTRIWVRRLALPIAMVIGGLIAIRPATEVVRAVPSLLAVVPRQFVEAPASWLPQVDGVALSTSVLQTVLFAAVLLAAGIFGSRKLID